MLLSNDNSQNEQFNIDLYSKLSAFFANRRDREKKVVHVRIDRSSLFNKAVCEVH